MFSKFVSLGSAYALLCLVFLSLTINFVLADSQIVEPFIDLSKDKNYYSDPVFTDMDEEEILIHQKSHADTENHVPEGVAELLMEFESAESAEDAEQFILEAEPSIRASIPKAPASYMLDTGDVLRLVVFGEAELTNRYEVGPAGTISVPLIGDVYVKGLTAGAAGALITEKLADGYLIKPSVSVEITDLRPFFILGEVRTPGSYTFIPEMNVLNAVAVAGGFTYRANQKNVDIVSKGAVSQEKRQKVSVETKVKPGDIIFIKERFF